jgi:hypothetical protein
LSGVVFGAVACGFVLCCLAVAFCHGVWLLSTARTSGSGGVVDGSRDGERSVDDDFPVTDDSARLVWELDLFNWLSQRADEVTSPSR